MIHLNRRNIDGLEERVKKLRHEISKTGNKKGKDAWGTYIAKLAELSSLADQERSLEAEIQYMLGVTLNGQLLTQVEIKKFK